MEETARKRTIYSVLRPILKKRDPQDILDSLDDGPTDRSQPYLTARQRMVVWSALCWLVTGLKESALGTWLCSRVTQLWESHVAAWLRRLPCYVTLFLQLALWLLLGWLVSDLYLGPPFFLLALFYWLYDGPLRRAVVQARDRRREPPHEPGCSVRERDQGLLLMGD